MRYLYTVLLVCLTPFFLLRLWWKGKKLPAYRERIAERFAYSLKPNKGVDIWVHAVSLGEVIAVTPLLEALLAKDFRLLVTTMTPTGSERVVRYFGAKITHQYVPYDLPWLMRRFLNHYRPRLGMMMETELWPNLISVSQSLSIPLVLVNGRLSVKSFQGYKPWRFWFKHLLNQFAAIWVQTADDQMRFIQLGASSKRVEVVGNMKFDLNTSHITLGRYAILKKAWGSHRPVLMLASTHEDEERQILTHASVLHIAIPDILILIAPRHPERFERVYQLSQSLGLMTAKASQPDLITSQVKVIILDALGELMQSYQCADYAFVGGSLVPIGGHNVLEPIALEVPVFSGPYVHNFKSIFETLMMAGAVHMVKSGEQLVEALVALYRDKAAKTKQINLATEILMKNRGVVEKYLERVERMFEV